MMPAPTFTTRSCLSLLAGATSFFLVACGGSWPAPTDPIQPTVDGWRIIDDAYTLEVTRAPDEPEEATTQSESVATPEPDDERRAQVDP